MAEIDIQCQMNSRFVLMEGISSRKSLSLASIPIHPPFCINTNIEGIWRHKWCLFPNGQAQNSKYFSMKLVIYCETMFFPVLVEYDVGEYFKCIISLFADQSFPFQSLNSLISVHYRLYNSKNIITWSIFLIGQSLVPFGPWHPLY